MTKPLTQRVSIKPSDLPAETMIGVVWSPGLRAQRGSCDDCPLFDLCSDAVAGGNFAGCESVLRCDIYTPPQASEPVPDEFCEADDEDMPCLSEMTDWTWKSR